MIFKNVPTRIWVLGGGSTLLIGLAVYWGITYFSTPQRVIRLIESSTNEVQSRLQDVRSVQILLTQDGKRVGELFSRGHDWRLLVKDAFSKKIKGDFNQVVVCFGSQYRSFPTPLENKNQLQSAKGVLGVELQWKKRKKNYCGVKSIATNRTPWSMLRVFSKELKIPFSELNTSNLQMRVYQTHQFYINLDSHHTVEMYRGNQLVTMDQVTRAAVQAMSQRLAGWLLNNMDQKTGRMQYKYWPSSGVSSKANNTIRQFMATFALQKWAESQSSPQVQKLADLNLQYNLKTFYGEERKLGFIDEFGKRKLGAAALAALSILVSSQSDSFQNQYEALLRSTIHQWQPTGEFKTFILQNRNDQQNFYPGEALFFWAHALEKNADSKLEDRFMKSVSYYMDWHRKNKNPAFVPWHTQSYFMRWKATKDEKLKNAIIEMNDWLISQMQDLEESEGYAFPDMMGRFYYPRGGFGPPHASATGVYLEGLIDAYQLAIEVQDQARQERYRKSILKGLREVMQLEFADEVDTFYVSKKEKVVGGLRTTVYDNTIRVDNIQHNLLALIKILERFQEQDFKFN